METLCFFDCFFLLFSIILTFCCCFLSDSNEKSHINLWSHHHFQFVHSLVNLSMFTQSFDTPFDIVNSSLRLCNDINWILLVFTHFLSSVDSSVDNLLRSSCALFCNCWTFCSMVKLHTTELLSAFFNRSLVFFFRFFFQRKWRIFFFSLATIPVYGTR